MANGGIIGPNNPVGKIGSVSKVSVHTASGTHTTGACTSQVDAIVVAGGGAKGTNTTTAPPANVTGATNVAAPSKPADVAQTPTGGRRRWAGL